MPTLPPCTSEPRPAAPGGQPGLPRYAAAYLAAEQLLDTASDLEAVGLPYTAARVREVALGLAGEVLAVRALVLMPHVSAIPTDAAVRAVLCYGVPGDDETLPLFPAAYPFPATDEPAWLADIAREVARAARERADDTSRGTFVELPASYPPCSCTSDSLTYWSPRAGIRLCTSCGGDVTARLREAPTDGR